MTCCKNTKLSLKTHFAFKEAYKFQWKNAHSTVLQNAWSQKKPILSLKNKFSYQKNNGFLWKTILDDKKTQGAIENQFGPSKKFKNPLKTQWHVAKTQSSLWKLILLLKRPINSNEKTPTAPSYKMPEAKKTNTFIEKQN